MEQSIFDIMTPKQIIELYFVFLCVTALIAGVSAALFTFLFENKKK